MEDDVREQLAAIRADVARLTATLDEFLPLIRAYLDPDQSGPRGFFMRRRLAETNGANNG